MQCKTNALPTNVSKMFQTCVKCLITWITFYSNARAVSEKNTTYNIAFLKMIEKWKSAVDKGKLVLADLSKAFDCLLHDLLLAKLHTYGFCYSSLKLRHSYLKNRKQRTKIDSTFRSLEEILFGVLQGSFL